MASEKSKTLFIYSTWTTFTNTDYNILATKYKIVKYQFKPVKGNIKTAIELIKQFFYLLFNIWRFDSVYIWFADSHSFIPILFSQIFNKRSFLVIGGYDVARMKHLCYGVFTSKIRSFFAVYSMNYCTMNLTVSKYVDRKVKWIAKKAKTAMIYNCVTLEKGNEQEQQTKDNLIITVGIVEKEQTFQIKGIDTFIEVAKLLPEYQFLIIGLNQSNLKHRLNNLPANLSIKEKIDHEDLTAYYQKAKVYCQLSRSESFGVALAEGLHFGCVPVVTNVGGMPEVIGNTGYIVKRDTEQLKMIIGDVMGSKWKPKVNPKDRINSIFTLEKRNQRVLRILNQHI